MMIDLLRPQWLLEEPITLHIPQHLAELHRLILIIPTVLVRITVLILTRLETD